MRDLSDHLFWDVDRAGIDPDLHASWLVKRVLEHGRWRDWKCLVAYYGRPGIGKLVTTLRSLDARALSFCSAWLDIPRSQFRCSDSTPFPDRSTTC